MTIGINWVLIDGVCAARDISFNKVKAEGKSRCLQMIDQD